MQRYSLLSQFSQHVRIIRIALLRLLVVFGTRFSRLALFACAPRYIELQYKLSPQRSPDLEVSCHLLLSVACYLCQLALRVHRRVELPRVGVSVAARLLLLLSPPLQVFPREHWPSPRLCSCHVSMSHMRSSAYVLHLSTLALWIARRAGARRVRMFHSSKLSPGLLAGCIILRTCVLLAALKMAAVFCQAPPHGCPHTNVWCSLILPSRAVGA